MTTSVPEQPAAVGAPLAANYIRIAPDAVAKIRNPILVVVFSILTLGIYMVFWWYFANRELADHGRARDTKELGDNPTMSTLALFPGALIVVPALWTMFTTFQRVQAAQRLNGQTPINGWLGLVIFLVISPVLVGYMQSGLNSAWNAVPQAEPVPATA
jgi:UDP-N-acetylmuramyl pentapeptide phosphotransferase/UDP-N-acetylglucosamine-1-phosphate transferase